MEERGSKDKKKIAGITVLTILQILLLLAFFHYQKLTGEWMKSVEETQELQKSYEELLQKNQEKIQDLEKQLKESSEEQK